MLSVLLNEIETLSFYIITSYIFDKFIIDFVLVFVFLIWCLIQALASCYLFLEGIFLCHDILEERHLDNALGRNSFGSEPCRLFLFYLWRLDVAPSVLSSTRRIV